MIFSFNDKDLHSTRRTIFVFAAIQGFLWWNDLQLAVPSFMIAGETAGVIDPVAVSILFIVVYVLSIVRMVTWYPSEKIITKKSQVDLFEKHIGEVASFATALNRTLNSTRKSKSRDIETLHELRAHAVALKPLLGPLVDKRRDPTTGDLPSLQEALQQFTEGLNRFIEITRETPDLEFNNQSSLASAKSIDRLFNGLDKLDPADFTRLKRWQWIRLNILDFGLPTAIAVLGFLFAVRTLVPWP